MKIILMWTINDLLVYGMVSGWNTYEKLSYPYYMENKKAFTFMNGGEACFFLLSLKVFIKLSLIQKQQK